MMSCVIKCDFCDKTMVEIQNIKVFKVNNRGDIVSIGKDMCGKCYDKLSKDNANKKITNYEKIRNMSKKEIAGFLGNSGCGCICCTYEYQNCFGGCLEGREMWLESEAREE